MKTVRFLKDRECGKKGRVKTLLDSNADHLIKRGYAELVEDEAKADNEGSPDSKPLSKMTVAELQAYAAEKSIDLGTATKKADIIEAITIAETKMDAPKEFSEYTIDELKAFALENKIDLGEATELEDILEIVENMAPKP